MLCTVAGKGSVCPTIPPIHPCEGKKPFHLGLTWQHTFVGFGKLTQLSLLLQCAGAGREGLRLTGQHQLSSS